MRDESSRKAKRASRKVSRKGRGGREGRGCFNIFMRLFFYGLFESFASFFREAVFLESAAGFAGDGVFDEGGFESGMEVVFPESWAMLEVQLLSDLSRRERFFIQ